MATKKKVINVSEDKELQKELQEKKEKREASGVKEPVKAFVPTKEAQGKANQARVISVVLWILAIAAEIFAIVWFMRNPQESTMFWVFVLGALAVDIVLCVIANLSWQKAHRLDPPSEKNGLTFFLKSQLGLIMTIVAFLPLIILLLTNKNMNARQKGIVGAVAGIALLAVALFFGINWNPASAEDYAEQTAYVEELTGQNKVYWTQSGTKYHLYEDCYTINSNRTDEIYSGTVAEARELKNITELCRICEDRWLDDHPESGTSSSQESGHTHS